MRILLIDDDDDMRRSIQECLAARNHEVRSYVTAREGLAILEFFKADLVISDIQMPGMDGIELLTQIRETNPDLPVILLTSELTVEMAIRAFRKRANDYLRKPVDLKALLDSIEKIGGKAASGRPPSQGLRSPGGVEGVAVSVAEKV
jgi:DNA-binding NtrC family response regulator